jgi:hypothetical protein
VNLSMALHLLSLELEVAVLYERFVTSDPIAACKDRARFWTTREQESATSARCYAFCASPA